MDSETLEKYKKAGTICAEVRDDARDSVKVGDKLLDIAERIEKAIRDKGGLPAFPVNLSLNDVAAHYTPTSVDATTIRQGDMLKIDIGVHIDGYIADTAVTVSFNKDIDYMIEATDKALAEAIKLCKPGAKLSELSETIEKTIRQFDLNPIQNLTGHGVDRYEAHAPPQIPNVSFKSDATLKENQVIAIEPFATKGKGFVKDSTDVFIFSMFRETTTRNDEARKIMDFASQFNGLPFAERWIPLDSVFKTRLALRELRMREALVDYNVLKEVSGQIVSQSEHTLIVKDEPIVLTA